jgi:hypothetical protein
MPISNQAIYQRLSSIKNECTRKTYETRLASLSKAMGSEIYDICKHPGRYIPKIKTVYPSACTQRNMVTVILAVFNMFADLKAKKANAYGEWTTFQKSLREQYTPETVSYKEELIEAYKKNIASKNYAKSMLLSLAVNAPWAVKHAGTMAIVYPPASKSPSENYVYMCPNKPLIVTSKRRVAMPRQLFVDISASVTAHPRSFVFIGSDKGPFRKQNSYAVFVKRTMLAATGKPIGINAI